ncbi:MAG: glycoside hydrolase family 127 protein [Sphingomonas sp.]
MEPAFAFASNGRLAPIASRHVELKPSLFADALAANRRYLQSLDPLRLLHNFYLSAGLPTRGPQYGGWEAEGIAGHSLGHWMSACSLITAHDGDPELKAKLELALTEMARIQKAHGDGYLGGTTVQRDGKARDGKIVFEEVRHGDIRTQGWDLNGAWVPVYTWHKVQAGLIDAYKGAGLRGALPILLGVADYFGTIVEGLDDSQVQTLLHAEHGGINEAFAETYALTGNARWLRIAEKLRHREVLDPLTEQRDVLAGLHANTQIPKLVGLARLYELTDNPGHATAARFFHERVVGHHSYVIGGNSEREHFGPPDQLADRLSNATCEACNSYNMLKLTRHLYSWTRQGALFDFYERVQLNHMLAHQRPDTGRFAYFMPLETGARRDFSTPEDSFWCCVGSGMESHAKHADSIYWQDGRALYVNLFIPSRLNGNEGGFALDMQTRYPMDGEIALTIERAPKTPAAIALRIPGWAEGARLTLNGAPVSAPRGNGYATLNRKWRPGDKIVLTLPMELRSESIGGDPTTVAFLSGPLVLAADLAPASATFDGTPPALLSAGTVTRALLPDTGAPHSYRLQPVLGEAVKLSPFFRMYDRRTAVYFKSFTAESWAAEKDAFLAADVARADLARRTIDIFHIGEMQPERDHRFESSRSSPGLFYGRSSRRLPAGETMHFRMARRPGNAVLRITYWGEDIDRVAEIRADGQTIATESRPGPKRREWIVRDYPLPPAAGRDSEILVFARQGDTVIYEARIIATA